MNLVFPFLLLFFPSLFNAQPTTNSPSPAPTLALDSTQLNLTHILSTHGCSAFSLALVSSTSAKKAFNDVVEGGLTVFCPNDDVWSEFSPKFKNLTPPAKTSLLEFHGVPIYMPLSVLKSNNGDTNTLATDGAARFDFTVQNDGEDVTVKTSITTAKVDGAGVFDEDPLVVYVIDKVLEPEELFTVDVVSPPKGSSDVGAAPSSDAPADSPDESLADQNADGNSAVRVEGGEFHFMAVALCAWMGFSLLRVFLTISSPSQTNRLLFNVRRPILSPRYSSSTSDFLAPSLSSCPIFFQQPMSSQPLPIFFCPDFPSLTFDFSSARGRMNSCRSSVFR